MLVSEAKTKLCPFIKMPDGDYYKHEDGQNIQNIVCICGDCMAWIDTTQKEVKTKRFLSKIYPKPEKEGYCARIGQC